MLMPSFLRGASSADEAAHWGRKSALCSWRAAQPAARLVWYYKVIFKGIHSLQTVYLLTPVHSRPPTEKLAE